MFVLDSGGLSRRRSSATRKLDSSIANSDSTIDAVVGEMPVTNAVILLKEIPY